MSKNIKRICKNCKLYDPKESVCTVTVINAGEYLELQVKPTDRCWWEKMSEELSMLDGEETFVPIEEVRIQYDLDNKKIKVTTPLERNTLNN